MKKLYEILKEKFINFIKWLWQECKDWRTFLLLVIVCVVIGMPVWLGYLLGFIFKWEAAIVAATAVWAFWLLPGAPFFAVSVSVTLAIKRVLEKRKAKILNSQKQDESRTDESEFKDKK